MTESISESPFPSYWTLAGPGESEVRIQRSRFVARAVPASSNEDVHEHLQAMAREYHDARHVCHAWRLGPALAIREKAHDDGEPSRTAGEPILKAIRRLDLTDTLVIVVRYFGGVKLGTGGLARAYGSAAEDALELAPRREIVPGRICSCTFPYGLQKSMEQMLSAHDGQVRDETFGAEVTWRLWLPEGRVTGFEEDLRERSSGSVELKKLEQATGTSEGGTSD